MRTKLTISVVILASILCSCVPSSDVPLLPPSISPEQSAEIDRLAEGSIQNGPLASLSIGIQFAGEPSLTEGYGATDIAANEKADTRSVYQIGSITKTFTAVSIMLLAGEGKVDLGRPITEYVEELPSTAESISVNDLLAHTSGLPNLEETSIDIDYSRTYVPREVIELVSNQFPELSFPPGTGYHYSNLGYFLLGSIIEKVAGMSYYDYLQSNLLDSLDMTETGDCSSVRGRIAQGYEVSGRELIPAESSNLSLAYSAGGLCSSVTDLLNWFTSLSSGDVVDRDTYEEMTTPVILPEGTVLQSGLGFIVGDFLAAQAIGHIGRTSGFESYMIAFSDDDLTIVVLSNTNPSDPYEISSLISSIREVVSN